MFNQNLEPILIPPRKLSNGNTVFADKDTLLEEKIITYDDGFYEIENLEDKKVRWLSDHIELQVHNINKYELLVLKTVNTFNKKAVIVRLLNKDSSEFFIYLTKEYEINEKIEIPIPLNNVDKIEIITDYFCPFEEKISNDQRRLSFLLENLYYIKEGRTFKQPVSYIQEASEDLFKDILKSNIIETKTDKYFNIEDKTFSIDKSLKSAILLYIPFINEGVKKSLDNLFAYKRSAKNIDLIIFSDTDLNYFNNLDCKFIKIPKIQAMKNSGYMAAQDKYALIAFLYGIQIAENHNLDRYFYYEWDCKIGCDYWYDILWDEFLNWPHEAYMVGTPVLKYPLSKIGNFIQNSSEYIYNYSKNTGVSMVVEQHGPFCLYTNGALTIYHTQKIKEMFANELFLIDKNILTFTDKIRAWDYESGIRLFKKYKQDAFKYVGWLNSSYSGCGDLYYNQKQRQNMLDTKLKCVIHQYKYI